MRSDPSLSLSLYHIRHIWKIPPSSQTRISHFVKWQREPINYNQLWIRRIWREGACLKCSHLRTKLIFQLRFCALPKKMRSRMSNCRIISIGTPRQLCSTHRCLTNRNPKMPLARIWQIARHPQNRRIAKIKRSRILCSCKKSSRNKTKILPASSSVWPSNTCPNTNLSTRLLGVRGSWRNALNGNNGAWVLKRTFTLSTTWSTFSVMGKSFRTTWFARTGLFSTRSSEGTPWT